MEQNTIYALGYFDGVHSGHRALLDACREIAVGCKSGAVTFSGHPQQLVSGSAVPLINTDFDRRSNPVIRQMLKSFKGTIISVSHDRKYIEEVADKVYELTESGLVIKKE